MLTSFPSPHPGSRVAPPRSPGVEGAGYLTAGKGSRRRGLLGKSSFGYASLGSRRTAIWRVASGTSTRRGSLTTVHTPTAQSAQPAGGKRVAWADTAKGFSILAVCLMHVVTLVPGGMETSWGAAKTALIRCECRYSSWFLGFSRIELLNVHFPICGSAACGSFWYPT